MRAMAVNRRTIQKKPMKLLKHIQFSIIIVTVIFVGSALLDNLFLNRGDQKPLLQTMLDRTDAFMHDLHGTPKKVTDFIAVESYASFDSLRDNDQAARISGTIKRGESFESSLRRQNIAADIRTSIIGALKKEIDFRRIKPEDNYLLELDNSGQLASFSYESGPFDVLTIKNSDDGYRVSKAPIELERQKVKISGEITSSLFASFTDKGEDMRLVYAFADIFASKIDFNTEIQAGDRYCLVVDKYYKDGKLVGYGKIDAAQYYRASGTVLEAYLHTSSSGRDAYFDQNGLGVGATFLRSPVPVGKLTSKFTYQRRHPITGRIKPHLGVDLAAPVGTPIMAAADGKVIDIGREGGFGNQLVLAHDGGYKTYYGHLSRFKGGLHRGSLVSKKEIIGYVGSTGVSTGPHLDYRIQQHTNFVDPFAMNFRALASLAGKELQAFKRETEAMDKLADFASFSPYPQVIKVSSLTITQKDELTLL